MNLKDIESFFKVLSSSVIVIAILGIPAVIFEFHKFNVPFNFITVDKIVGAGFLPTPFLILLGLYFNYVKKEHENKEKKSSVTIFIIPFYIGKVIQILGLLSIYILLIWGILKLIFLGLGEFISSLNEISNRTLLSFITIIVSVISILSYFSMRSGKKKKNSSNDNNQFKNFSWETKILIIRYLQFFRMVRVIQYEKLNPVSYEEIKSRIDPYIHPDKLVNNLKYAHWIIITIIICLFSIKAIVYLFEPTLFHKSFFADITLYLIGIVYGFLFIVFDFIINYDKRNVPDWMYTLRICFAIIIFLTIEISYICYIYPKIPTGIGGGKPIPVSIWISSDNISPDFSDELKNSKIVEFRGSSVIRIDSTYLLWSNKENYILTNSSDWKSNELSSMVMVTRAVQQIKRHRTK